ncbi:MAG: CBS domain-containing protein [Nitrospiria bacterium]
MRTLSGIMSTELKWVNRGETVRAAAGVMTRLRIGSVLVGGEGPPGIVTETDIVRRVVAADRNPCATFVEEIMNHPPIALDERRSIEEAGDLMAEHRIRHVAVTRGGEVIGLVSVRDLLSRVQLLDISVERMMSRLPVVVPIDETARNVAALMTQAAVSGVLVSGHRMSSRPLHFQGLARRDLVGIVTGTDIVQEIVGRDRDPGVTRVADILSPLLQTIDGREPIAAAFHLMALEELRHVAVTTHDEITGLLSVEDVFEPAWLHVAASPLRQGRS